MNFDREQTSDNDDSPRSASNSAGDDEPYLEHSPTSPVRFLDTSPTEEEVQEDDFQRQQREILARLQEQFVAYQAPSRSPNAAAESTHQQIPPQMLLLYQQQMLETQQRLLEEQARKKEEEEARDEARSQSSYPTPPPSTREHSPRNNSSYAYDDQYKQVRQGRFHPYHNSNRQSTSSSNARGMKNFSEPATSNEHSANQRSPTNDFSTLYEINDDPKRKEFLDDLFTFMKERGTPINRLPIMAKSVLDLYELYKLVIGRGGLVNVINKKLWQEIIKDLNLPSSITSAAFTLRTQYVRYLYPYETDKFHLSTEAELTAAIENNKRDGSRRSCSNNSNNYMSPPQFSPQPNVQQRQQQQMMRMAMNQQQQPQIDVQQQQQVFMQLMLQIQAQQMAAAAGANQVEDLSNNNQSPEIDAVARNRMMLMMLLAQQAAFQPGQQLP